MKNQKQGGVGVKPQKDAVVKPIRVVPAAEGRVIQESEMRGKGPWNESGGKK